jgi:hypothetical protein
VLEDLAAEDEVNMLEFIRHNNRPSFRKAAVTVGMAGILLLAGNLQLKASTIYWLGADSSQMTFGGTVAKPNWNTALTGTGGTRAVPTSGDNVVIDSAHTPYGPFSGTTTGTFVGGGFNTLTLMGTAAMTVNSSLTISPQAAGITVGTGASGTTTTNANTVQGTINVATGGALTFSSALQGATLSGSILVAGGAATLSGNLWTNTGTISATGGTVSLTGTIANAGGTISQSSSGTLNNSGTIIGGRLAGTLSNGSGTVSGVTVQGGGLINFGNVIGLVANNGTLNATTIGDGTTPTTVTGGTISGATFARTATVTGALNTGTFTNSSGSSTWSGGTNSSTGTLTASGGTLSIVGNPVTNNGLINGGGGGTVTLASGATVNNGALGTVENVSLTGVTLTGGTLAGTNIATTSNTLENLINSGSTAVNSGTTTLLGTISNTGSFNVAGGTLELNGTTVTGSGTGTITTGATSLVESDGTVHLSGLADAGAFNLTVATGTTTNTGDWNIGTGDTTQVDSGATFDVTGNINNSGGVLQIDSTGTADATDYTQNSGTLTLNGSLIVNVANLLSGTVTGTGNFGSGTTVNSGTASGNGVALNVGGSATPGTNNWSIAGYNQTNGGSIEFDINSLSAYDQLTTSGDVSLAGALVLGGPYGYTDPAGTIFTLIQSAGLTGTFTSIPTLTGNWEIVYTADDVLLENPAESGPVPEPAPYWLIGGAIMALGLIRRRRQIAA